MNVTHIIGVLIFLTSAFFITAVVNAIHDDKIKAHAVCRLADKQGKYMTCEPSDEVTE